MVASAEPTLWARVVVISTLASPLIPEDPKSLGFT